MLLALSFLMSVFVIFILRVVSVLLLFFFQAEDGIRDIGVTGVQTCALPIYLRCTLTEVEGKVAELELPPAVDLKVLEAPPGIRGDTATNVTKPAKVETGIEVGVPIFINPDRKSVV